MNLQVGQMLHRVKAADFNCVRVEAVAFDWSVVRALGGVPILILPNDVNTDNLKACEAEEFCPFSY